LQLHHLLSSRRQRRRRSLRIVPNLRALQPRRLSRFGMRFLRQVLLHWTGQSQYRRRPPFSKLKASILAEGYLLSIATWSNEVMSVIDLSNPSRTCSTRNADVFGQHSLHGTFQSKSLRSFAVSNLLDFRWGIPRLRRRRRRLFHLPA